VAVIRSIDSANSELAEKIRLDADYFERNAAHMRSPKFRRQHLFVGSGVIETGCKTVIGSRLKQPGMFWTVRGPIRSSPCDVVISTAGLRITGRRAGRRDFHFCVAHLP
jgi:hypothetical protein